MKRIAIILILIACGLSLRGQNITTIEYFFDTDPGFGNGTAVTITPAPTITNLVFNVSIAAQADGFHNLFVRAKDANNNWSSTYHTLFYKISASALAPAPNVNKIEYFFDTDPGFGAGIDVPITPATSIINQAFSIPLTSAADGFHNLYIRTRDANNKWTPAFQTLFYKFSSTVGAPATNITKVEYFVDADPGYGAGTNVPLTPALTINNLSFTVPLGSTTVGNHTLTVRTSDANNNWSIVAIKTFAVCNHPGTTVSAATAIASSGFTANWADVPGSINYQLDVSTDNFSTFVSGYNSKVITAPATSTAVTGLPQASTFQYRVRAVSSCTSVESNILNVTTLATPPSAQPTTLSFTSVAATSLTAFFTAPSTPPTGYLVVKKIGTSPTFVPINNTTYTVGQTVGDGVVVHYGSAFLFNEISLTPDTRYFYDVFSFNQANGSTTYLTTLPLENNVSTVALEPTGSPTNLQFTSITDAGFQVAFDAAAGSPTGYLVLRKTGSAPTAVPIDGTTYATTIGTDVIVSNGPATSFAQSGLSQNTQYYFVVYTYNGSGTSINYRTTAPLQGSQLTPITPPSPPTGLIFSNVTPSSMTVAFTAPTQAPSGYIVVRKQASSPTFAPQINTAYTIGQNVSDGVIAYAGASTSFEETGLAASTTYFYDVFSFNQQAALISYQVTAPLEGSKSTFTAEPSAQPSGLVINNQTSSSLKVAYAAASPAPAGYLVVRKVASAPSVFPADGTAYTPGDVAGDGVVAYVGTALTFDDVGLLAGTNYFYAVLSFNGAGSSINYLSSTNVSNTGSGLTLPGKPAAPTTSTPAQTSFMVNWTAVTGASGYRLDVSKDNFISMVSGFDDVAVNTTSTAVTGLEPGAAYKFRVRAVNASGTSVSSDATQQFTIPSTPIITAASSVGQETFNANWNPVTGATEYFIDVSRDDFTTFVPAYQNKSITAATTALVSGLLPGIIYNYRVRASNSGGTSPSSNPTGSQLLLPATPVGQDATNTTPTSFKAKWIAVIPAVAEYRLDVTLTSDNFTPSLLAYTNIKITVNTEAVISNLDPNKVYSYRVRAVNATGDSPSSTPISVSTPKDGVGILKLTATAAASEVTVQVEGGTPPYKVLFFHRKITETDFTFNQLTTTDDGSTFKAAINASMLDDLGVQFHVDVTDNQGATAKSGEKFIYKSIPTIGATIPFTRSGGVVESYEIFSVPYQVNDNLVGSIFEEMGEINKSKWRLLRYQGGKNTDLSLVSRIEPGKGYWFNRKENINVQFSGGTVTQANQDEPFVLQLEKGWNQVGNPFSFDIKWAEVLSNNQGVLNIGNLRVFNPTGLHLNDESLVLKAWGGGFVHNGNDATVTLEFPVTLKKASGRTAGGPVVGSQLDASKWFVPISIRQGSSLNARTTIGMHDDASTSADRFDDVVAPRFLNYLEFYTEHKDFFSPRFSSDIVPPANGHTWEFRFESSAGDDATLEWDNRDFGANNAQLLLYDMSRNLLIDMRSEHSYKFKAEAGQSFRIFYGRSSDDLIPDITSLGNPYPNPFRSQVTIPFIVERDDAKVDISVIDAMGKNVRTLINGSPGRGMHSATWDGTSHSNDLVSSGLYMIRMNVDGIRSVIRVIKY